MSRLPVWRLWCPLTTCEKLLCQGVACKSAKECWARSSSEHEHIFFDAQPVYRRSSTCLDHGIASSALGDKRRSAVSMGRFVGAPVLFSAVEPCDGAVDSSEDAS